jgi:DNA mismatch repair protein MutS
MLSLYIKNYKDFSAKYGAKTCICLMVGSFYELYDEVNSNGDTLTPIRDLAVAMNLTLTEDKKDSKVYLKAGFPDYKLHKFAQVLTQSGWTVVVIDQVKDTHDTVIDRVPTRILSPGTHHEIATRDRMSVAGIFIDDGYGISVIDIPTGEVFSLHAKSPHEVLHMIQVYNVKEIIVKQETLLHDEESIKAVGIRCTVHLSKVPLDKAYSSELYREEFFQSTFQKSLLPVCQALSLPFPRNAVVEKGLCTLLQFIKEHFPVQKIPILRHTMHCPDEYLRVNNNVLEQVNYITHKDGQQSVLDLVDKARSAIGGRALRERMLRPITCPILLEKRWSDIEWATRMRTDPEIPHALDRNLKGLYDLPRLHTKLSAGNPSAQDILHLFQSYTHVECLLQGLESTPLACPPRLVDAIRAFRTTFEESFDEQKAVRRENGEFVGFLSAGVETLAVEEQISGLVQTWQKLWSSFCAKIQVSPAGCELQRKADGDIQFECPRALAKSILRGKDSFKGGLECIVKKSGPLIITCDVLNDSIRKIQDLHRKLEHVLRTELQAICDRLWEELETIQKEWIEWIGYVDCTLTLAAVAVENVWVKPSISDGLRVRGMRHPLIEARNTRLSYVKHDVCLGSDRASGWLLYGVNASGKSSLMKAVGICVLLAQAGSFVPADFMEIRPYTSLYSRIWSHDNLWAGLSSFAVEIGELRDILDGVDDRSLVLGDEVCSGTESISATALVAATLEHLDERRAHFLFATHLHDLIKINGCLQRPSIAVYHLRVIRTLEGKLIYDRTLQPGSGSSTYGLEVAKAMGLPFSFMERAYSIRKEIGGEKSVQSTWNSEIFKEKCEVCGITLSSELEVHHIEHREHGGGNSPRNLIVLCKVCHDKHHAGLLEIFPLQQTSDGAERLTVTTGTTVATTTSTGKKTERSGEEMETIRAALDKFKGRPPDRILGALQEEGIYLKASDLKRFARKV